MGYNLSPTFADVWWKDIKDKITETYFVWVDNVDHHEHGHPNSQDHYDSH